MAVRCYLEIPLATIELSARADSAAAAVRRLNGAEVADGHLALIYGASLRRLRQTLVTRRKGAPLCNGFRVWQLVFMVAAAADLARGPWGGRRVNCA